MYVCMYVCTHTHTYLYKCFCWRPRNQSTSGTRKLQVDIETPLDSVNFDDSCTLFTIFDPWIVSNPSDSANLTQIGPIPPSDSASTRSDSGGSAEIVPTLTTDSDPRIVPTLQISSIEFVIEFVIQTLDQIHCTIKSTSRSDTRPSVHVYAQEHTRIYIYICI